MISTPCLLFTDVDQVAVARTELPDPGPDDVVVNTTLSSISPGTELRCLAGAQDGLGRDHFPFIPGYSLVGTVVHATGRHVGLLGQTVFSSGARRAQHRAAWGGHIGTAVVPGDSVVRVPPTIRSEDAVLAKLAAIAHRGFSLAQARPGDPVIIVGLGPVGQISARLFAHAGARVLAVDLVPARVEAARAAGVRAIVAADSLETAVRAELPAGAPIVVDATGAPGLLRASMALLRDKPWDESDTPGGRLVVQGSYPADITLPSTTAFAKELTLLWPRDSQRRDMERILDLLGTGELSFAGLLGGIHAPADAPQVYRRLQAREGGLLTAAFRW